MAENLFNGSDNSGSPIEKSVPNPNNPSSGLGQTQASGSVDQKQYEELESLMGRQSTELGEYRKFFTDIAPLLDKLDKSPEIVEAIINENITPEMAKAALEGKITISDAEVVKKAADEVKEELGKEEYKGASPEEISKLIEEKAREIKGDFKKELKERDELYAFENNVNDFIAKTYDFEDYATEIDNWLDEHEGVTDIAVAYYAVKGEISEKEAIKKAEADRAEASKMDAMNMGGGAGNATRVIADESIIDSLISGNSNPNTFR